MEPSILTYSGKLFIYDDVESNIIDITDIAAALSKINRFGGHTATPWSVGQHSLLVLYLMRITFPSLTQLLGLEALIHDAMEAYVGDIPTPLKRMPIMEQYTILHDSIDKHIRAQFNLPSTMSPLVKDYDKLALEIERYHLMNSEFNWKSSFIPSKQESNLYNILNKMSPIETQNLFLTEFKKSLD